MVTLMLCLALSMRLYTGEKPALGSMASEPARLMLVAPVHLRNVSGPV
jgi:hypothetical protein